MKDDLAQPLVSIIIPCYNYGRFLGEAVESALTQTYAPVEIIVIDDGSTDDTEVVARAYAERGVIYCKQANAGPSAARNFGAQKADGEFIMFLDADDLLERTYVQECFEALRLDPGAGFAYTQLRLFGRESGVSHFPAYSRRRLAVGNYIHNSSLLRHELVEQYPYNEDLRTGWEDWDFFLTLAEHHVYGVLVNQPLLLYRKHATHSSVNDKSMRNWAMQQMAHRELLTKRHASLYPWYVRCWVELDYCYKRFKAQVKRRLVTGE